eukprot:42649-Prymnesium_polylepis.1
MKRSGSSKQKSLLDPLLKQHSSPLDSSPQLELNLCAQDSALRTRGAPESRVSRLPRVRRARRAASEGGAPSV